MLQGADGDAELAGVGLRPNKANFFLGGGGAGGVRGVLWGGEKISEGDPRMLGTKTNTCGVLLRARRAVLWVGYSQSYGAPARRRAESGFPRHPLPPPSG